MQLRKKEDEYIKWSPLDFVRTIAALCVFLLHSTLFVDCSFMDHSLWKLCRTPAWGGVWIFFILSGYLAGRSYAAERYTFTVQGIKKYYFQRIRKTYLPTLGFILFCMVFCYMEFFVGNMKIWRTFIFATYNGSPSTSGIGATWYVFTLTWLYILTPMLCKLIKKMKGLKARILILSICIILGGVYRVFAFYSGLEWVSRIYTPFYANLDLFISGIILGYTIDAIYIKLNIKHIKAGARYLVGIIIFLVTILINIYYYANRVEVYQLLFPTIYILVCGIYVLLTYKIEKQCIYARTSLRGKIQLAITGFSRITFGFYLFHPLIMDRIAPYVQIEGHVLRSYIVFVCLVFVLSIICGIIFNLHNYLGSKEKVSWENNIKIE